MDVGVKDLLPCGGSDIGAEIEPLHVWSLSHDRLATDGGEPMQGLALFGGGREYIGDMPLWDEQRMKRADRKSIPDGESQFVFA
jgi:hypothetical protein